MKVKTYNGKQWRNAITIPDECRHDFRLWRIPDNDGVVLFTCHKCGAYKTEIDSKIQYPTYWKRLHEANQ